MDNIGTDPVITEIPDLDTLQIKILYWGPGEAGKTTNFLRLKEIFSGYLISKGFSIETTTKRTLWNDSVHFRFELKPFNLELIINLSTTTGQKRFLNTREYILQNTDGIVFVADSSPIKISENIRSFEELQSFLGKSDTPIFVLLNKRDVKNAISVSQLRQDLDLPEESFTDINARKFIYESIANQPNQMGEVKDIFLDLIQEILKQKVVCY